MYKRQEQAKIEQLEKAAEQLRIWAYSGNDKIFKRAQSMEKRIERMRTTDRPKKERKMEVRFGEREFRGDEVLTSRGSPRASAGAPSSPAWGWRWPEASASP